MNSILEKKNLHKNSLCGVATCDWKQTKAHKHKDIHSHISPYIILNMITNRWAIYSNNLIISHQINRKCVQITLLSVEQSKKHNIKNKNKTSIKSITLSNRTCVFCAHLNRFIHIPINIHEIVCSCMNTIQLCHWNRTISSGGATQWILYNNSNNNKNYNKKTAQTYANTQTCREEMRRGKRKKERASKIVRERVKLHLVTLLPYSVLSRTHKHKHCNQVFLLLGWSMLLLLLLYD